MLPSRLLLSARTFQCSGKRLKPLLSDLLGPRPTRRYPQSRSSAITRLFPPISQELQSASAHTIQRGISTAASRCWEPTIHTTKFYNPLRSPVSYLQYRSAHQSNISNAKHGAAGTMSTEKTAENASFYDLKAELPGVDKYYNFDRLRGGVVLVVNVASKW
jgi:hypothetical protein